MVLSPDEFLASLSPEFMIDLADQEVGASHPALTRARSQLQSGHSVESLVSIRTAFLNR